MGTKGAPATEHHAGGSETAVLRGSLAGNWRSVRSEQMFMTGVHYVAVRVESHRYAHRYTTHTHTDKPIARTQIARTQTQTHTQRR